MGTTLHCSPIGFALVDGRLIAEAARYPLAGHIAGVHPSVFQVYLAQCPRTWEGAVMHLRNPASEITASALARVESIEFEWFAERRHMIDKLLLDVDAVNLSAWMRSRARGVKSVKLPRPPSFSADRWLGPGSAQPPCFSMPSL